jgi:hypothetical protein
LKDLDRHYTSSHEKEGRRNGRFENEECSKVFTIKLPQNVQTCRKKPFSVTSVHKVIKLLHSFRTYYCEKCDEKFAKKYTRKNDLNRPEWTYISSFLCISFLVDGPKRKENRQMLMANKMMICH